MKRSPGLVIAAAALVYAGLALSQVRGGEWQGILETTIEDGPHIKTSHSLRVHGLPPQALQFVRAGDVLMSGGTVKVKGSRSGNTITVESAVQTSAAICTPIGAQKTIVLMVNMPGTAAPNITPTQVHDIFFASGQRSVSDYWRESSYGQTWAEGDVKGWYTLDAPYTCDQVSSIRDAAIRIADSEVDFSQYARIFVLVTGFADPCNWSGVSNVGCAVRSSDDGVFEASTSWIAGEYFASPDTALWLSIHEGGHALGLSHEGSRYFEGEALGAPGAVGYLVDYGDMFSSLGGYFSLGHYSAPQKAQLGWLTPAVVVNDGTFFVDPTDVAGPVNALKIRRGVNPDQHLWVEFRRNAGLYESAIFGRIPVTYSGGLIHYQDAFSGTRAHLLDFTPLTAPFEDGVLSGSWMDPYTNLSLTMDGSQSRLSVSVDYGQLPITAALTVPAVPVKRNSRVLLYGAVKQGEAPIAGAEFTFTLTLTTGAKVTNNAVTDSSGLAVWDYRVRPNDPIGQYALGGQATYGNETIVAAVRYFSVTSK